MKLFILPHKKSELLFLNSACLELSLPVAIEWSTHHLNCLISDLVMLPERDNLKQPSTRPRNLEKELEKVGAIIIFHGFKQDQIKKVVQYYKKNRKWPIFAVVTPASLKMNLECLIDHLLSDRSEEKEIRQKQKKSSTIN